MEQDRHTAGLQVASKDHVPLTGVAICRQRTEVGATRLGGHAWGCGKSTLARAIL